MDSNTYLAPTVIQESRHFVNVKLNVKEELPENVKLALRYNIEQFPTILWLDSEGNERKRVVGQYYPDELAGEMQSLRQAANS